MNPNDPNQQIQNSGGQITTQAVQPAQPVQVPLQQPVQPVLEPPIVVQPVAQQPQTPTQPVSVPLGKENAGVSIPKPPEQWIQETAPVAEVAPEIKDAGVEPIKGEVMEVPTTVQAHIQPVGLATPVPTEPTLDFPMTEEKAEGIVKMHKKVKDSIYWLAMLIVRQFKMLRFKQTHKEEEATA